MSNLDPGDALLALAKKALEIVAAGGTISVEDQAAAVEGLKYLTTSIPRPEKVYRSPPVDEAECVDCGAMVIKDGPATRCDVCREHHTGMCGADCPIRGCVRAAPRPKETPNAAVSRPLCGFCKKNPVAYEGAIFCGAACTARYEAQFDEDK